MKKVTLLFIALLTAVWSTAQTQTQQGYVKTKGRLVSDGSVIPGQRIPSASVILKGGNDVLSNANGNFSLVLPSSKFYLQNVQKPGYVLTDPDVLSKEYSYSTNDLVLVMETPTDQWQDKHAAEKAMREQLQRQVDEQRLELDSLKEQQRISDEEYRARLQRIFELYDENDKLVNEMAEAYAKIDYDQLDEHNRLIRQYILAGELKRADSLIHSKGDMDQRISDLRRHQEANAREAENLVQRQEQLAASQAGTQRDLEDIAQDCYNLFEICKMQHLNDSAAYWIEKRASLDTTNVEWLLEAGSFVFNFLSDFDKAKAYYNTALLVAQLSNNAELIANCYNDIGELYSYLSDFDQAIDNLEKSIKIRQSVSENDAPSFLQSYGNLGYCYAILGQLDKALELFENSLTIIQQNYGEHNTDIALCFNNIGMTYTEMGRAIEALNYFNKALAIQIELIGECSREVASTYNNIAGIFCDLDEYDDAIEYEKKALLIYKTLFGDNHPETATSFLNLCSFYNKSGNCTLALSYGEKALDIYQRLYGESSFDVSICYNNLGRVYQNLKEYDKALEYINKSLSIKIAIFGENHPQLAISYNNIGSILNDMEQYEEAITFYLKSLSIGISAFGDIHPSVSNTYANIGVCYENLGEYDKALSMYNKALLSLPEEHPRTKTIRNKIAEIQAKLNEQENPTTEE